MIEQHTLLQFGLCWIYILDTVGDRNAEIEHLHQYVQTHWVDISGFKGPKKLYPWTLKMGQIGCPETLVRNYHYLPRNNPEEHSS